MARVDKHTRTKDTRCFICKGLGQTTPGKFWCIDCEVGYCQGCEKTHSAIPTCRDHDLCDIKDKGQIDKRRKVKCKEHNEEQKLYCKDCNQIHCQLCFVDHHRQCENVVTIKSFLSDMNLELSKVAQQYDQQEKESKSLRKKKKERVSQLNSDKYSAIKEIHKASQTAIDLIKEKEKLLTDQVQQIINNGIEELRSDVKVLDIQLQTYRQYRQYIKQAVSSGSGFEVCDVYRLWKSGQLGVWLKVDKQMGGSVVFSKNYQITDSIGSLHLGDIVTTYKQLDTKSSPLQNDVVDIRLDNDEEVPGLCHVTVLEVEGVETIVVTDYNNKCVKSFFTKNKETFQNKFPMSSAPRGITHWRDQYVMVALPGTKEIVTIAVTPTLVLVSRISTSKSYVCLAVLTPSSFAAGCSDCVHILNMQGEVMESIKALGDGKLFSEPHFMCVTKKGHILVSDWHKSAVTCLTSDWKLMWETQTSHPFYPDDTSSPRGIAIIGEDIFVAEQGRQRLIQLSMSGEYVAHMLTSEDDFEKSYDLFCDEYPHCHCCRIVREIETINMENAIIDPYGICVDKHGSLLLCDNGRLLIFNQNCLHLQRI